MSYLMVHQVPAAAAGLGFGGRTFEVCPQRRLLKMVQLGALVVLMSLATAACGPEPSSSTSSGPSDLSSSARAGMPEPTSDKAAGIPESLWSRGVADVLRPAGLGTGQLSPNPAPVSTVFRPDLDRIGDWRLLKINDARTQLVIQYSQGGGCARGHGVVVAETSSAVALIPTYTNQGSGACDAVLHAPSGTINLRTPLGDRRLLHLPGDGTLTEPPQ
jgi:hypothetical protein